MATIEGLPDSGGGSGSVRDRASAGDDDSKLELRASSDSRKQDVPVGTVTERHHDQQEEITLNAQCKCCNEVILREVVTSGAGVPIDHRVVVGSFVQFLHPVTKEPIGPWWGYCAKCVLSGSATFPIDLPEVRSAYRELTE